MSVPTALASGPVRLSPQARAALRAAPAPTITAGFWHERRRVNARVAVPQGRELLETSGNLHNLRMAAGAEAGEFRGPHPFQDTDVRSSSTQERVRSGSAWRPSGGFGVRGTGRPVGSVMQAIVIELRVSSGWTALARTSARTLLAATGLAIATYAVTVLVSIILAFCGVAVGSVLSTAVAVQVHGTAVALILLLALATVTHLQYAAVRERAPEFAVLCAVGWLPRHLGVQLAWEGAATLATVGTATRTPRARRPAPTAARGAHFG